MNLSNGIDSFAQANYTYGTRGRIATVGNNTDTLTYTYVPGTNMIGSAAWQNASINTVNSYDQYKRLTNIAVNGANVYGYTLNDKNQRTSATLPDGNKWNYTYDVMGQLTGAVKQDTANNPLANMNYFYDLIGNRTSATENSATTTYASNLVNQYTAVNAVVPVYDLDGNMTNYNGWSYTYNGENRLIVAENAAGVRVEADYDYMGRRIFKKVYNNNTLVKHSVFVYDGFKQIAEFDALNNNSLKASYLWQPVGLDVVLLRNNEYLVADGNKNIIQVRNAIGSVTDSYVYDPFGKVTHNGTSENLFQFSSEFSDSETGLVYYNYRYHMPELGRWINRDPIEEEGGTNLYQMNTNSPLIYLDKLGLKKLSNGEIIKDIKIKKKNIKWWGIVYKHVLKGTSNKDLYGHWWIEMGSESYGWWPAQQVGFKETILGVNGVLNRQGFSRVGTATRDPHHGDAAEHEKSPKVDFGGFLGILQKRKINYGKAKNKLCKCVSVDDIKSGIREFANSYKGGWSYPMGPNCHTFVSEALENNCLEE